MKIETKYKPEIIASKDITREYLCDPYLDADAGKVVATDGHRMIVVPAGADGDSSGFVSSEAFVEGRRLAKKAKVFDYVIEGREKLSNGAVYTTEQGRKFPPWKSVVPEHQPGDEDTVTFGLNARYLKELVDALGGKENVVFTVKVPKHREEMLDPILVQVDKPYVKKVVSWEDYRDPPAFGVLMPAKVVDE